MKEKEKKLIIEGKPLRTTIDDVEIDQKILQEDDYEGSEFNKTEKENIENAMVGELLDFKSKIYSIESVKDRKSNEYIIVLPEAISNRVKTKIKDNIPIKLKEISDALEDLEVVRSDRIRRFLVYMMTYFIFFYITKKAESEGVVMLSIILTAIFYRLSAFFAPRFLVSDKFDVRKIKSTKEDIVDDSFNYLLGATCGFLTGGMTTKALLIATMIVVSMIGIVSTAFNLAKLNKLKKYLKENIRILNKINDYY